MLSNNFDSQGKSKNGDLDDLGLLDQPKSKSFNSSPISHVSPNVGGIGGLDDFGGDKTRSPTYNMSNAGGMGDDDGHDFAKRLSNVNQHLTQQANANSNHVNPVSPVQITSTTTTSTTGNKYTPTFTDEDYAAELQSEYNKENKHSHENTDSLFEPSYDSAFDLPEIVTHSEDHHRYISLKRTGTIIKAVSLLILFFSIMTYFVQAWWLMFSFGLVMNPVGFYAAHYFKSRMFLMYNAYLAVDIIFRLGFLFANIKNLNGFGVFISFVIVFMQGYFTYFCWNFYKRLPKTMNPTLREFFRQDTGLFSI